MPGSLEVPAGYRPARYVEPGPSVAAEAAGPLSDRLAASAAFTADTYAVGGTARITVTPTNRGDADLPRIVALCDRSGGEGPHVIGMDLGDLKWEAGVAVPAGSTGMTTALFQDRDGDGLAEPDESLPGLSLRSVDWFSGETVRQAVTDTRGQVGFTGVPAGPYWLEIDSPWDFDPPPRPVPVRRWPTPARRHSDRWCPACCC